MVTRGDIAYESGMDTPHVVVIGGSSGIGLGIAEACAQRGATVTLVGRAADKLARAAAQISGARTIAADLTVEAKAARALAQCGTVDHVVVTAVVGCYAPVRELDLARARATLDSKLVLALHVAKHARIAPGGSLTLTSGIAAQRPMRGGAVVAAANGALDAMVRALALELAPIRVNALSPGWVDTPVWDTIAGDAKAQRFADHAARLPAGRVGTPADLAHAALFLMDSRYTTGAVLHVDGGHPLV